MKQQIQRKCPFCFPHSIIVENELGRVIPDRYPVNPGHLLIVPRRHCTDFFELTDDERTAMWKLLSRARAYLQDRHQPDGYNIGVNCGPAAGQSIEHVHIHMIPRYSGDLRNPLGGVRGILPTRRMYP